MAHSFGTYILTASTAIQLAEERERDGHGVFTKALIDCLREGGKESITVDDWYEYAYVHLRLAAKQTPVKWGLREEGPSFEIGNFKAKHERERQRKREQLEREHQLERERLERERQLERGRLERERQLERERLISSARVRLGYYVALGELTEEQVEDAIALLKRDEARLFPRDRRHRDDLIRFSKGEASFLEVFGAGHSLRPEPAPKPPEDEVRPPTTPPEAPAVDAPLTLFEPPAIDQPATSPEPAVVDQTFTPVEPADIDQPAALPEPPVFDPRSTPSASEALPGVDRGGELQEAKKSILSLPPTKALFIPAVFAIGVVTLAIYFYASVPEIVSVEPSGGSVVIGGSLDQDEMNRLASAKFDEAALRTLALDAKTPKVQAEAQRRLNVIATEKNGYEAVMNDKAGLTEFRKKPCEACLDQDAARMQLQLLIDQEAGNAAREEAQHRPDVIATEKLVSAPSGATSSSNLVGYVTFAHLDNVNKHFNIDGKPNTRFPAPNDTITANDGRRELWAIPYHWDINSSNRHPVKPSLMDIRLGQKFKIGGDVVISVDPDKRRKYAIAPVAEVIGKNLPKIDDFFALQIASNKILGYAYIGYTQGANTFKNSTSPKAIYPAPNDELVALKDVWLRAGPRRWDAAKQDYVDGTKVQKIKEGQSIIVGGDTILDKGGVSIWAPISAIYPSSR